MPGTNGGTGYPYTFRCAKCKTRFGRRQEEMGFQRRTLQATGRTRPMLHRGYRQTTRKIEYVCGCGHRGWTQHMDGERLLAQLIRS
jgi:hypothetical protein